MTAGRPIVLLDMSGVVFVNGTSRLIRDLAAETKAPASELGKLLLGADSWALRRGELTADAFWDRMHRPLAALAGIGSAAIRRRWIDAFVPQDGMLDLIAELASAGIVLGTVAETTAERAAELDRRYRHERHLRARFYSFERGADKRDGTQFARAAAALRPTEHTVVMVEDDAASAAWARRLGFVAIIFTDAATLRNELVSLGALPPRDDPCSNPERRRGFAAD